MRFCSDCGLKISAHRPTSGPSINQQRAEDSFSDQAGSAPLWSQPEHHIDPRSTIQSDSLQVSQESPSSALESIGAAIGVTLLASAAITLLFIGIGGSVSTVSGSGEAGAGIALLGIFLLLLGFAAWLWRNVGGYWALCGVLFPWLALPVYVFRQRRGSHSKKTGLSYVRFPAIRANGVMAGLGVALIITGIAVPEQGDAGSSSQVASVGELAETPKPTKTPEPTENPKPTNTPEPSSTPEPTHTPDPPDVWGTATLSFSIDQPPYEAEFEVAVVGVERRSEAGSHEAAGSYVVLELRITNLGRQTQSFPFGDGYVLVSALGEEFNAIRLLDGEMRTFNHDFSATYALYLDDEVKFDTSDELQPGITYTYKLVFDVPTGSDTFTVLIGSKDEVLIRI